MGSRKEFDFKRHTLPPVSKKYLLRVILYVVVLFLIVLLYKGLNKHFSDPTQNEDEITNFTIQE